MDHVIWTFTITVTDDMILKTLGWLGALGLFGMAINGIRKRYREIYGVERHTTLVYRRGK